MHIIIVTITCLVIPFLLFFPVIIEVSESRDGKKNWITKLFEKAFGLSKSIDRTLFHLQCFFIITCVAVMFLLAGRTESELIKDAIVVCIPLIFCFLYTYSKYIVCKKGVTKATLLRKKVSWKTLLFAFIFSCFVLSIFNWPLTWHKLLDDLSIPAIWIAISLPGILNEAVFYNSEFIKGPRVSWRYQILAWDSLTKGAWDQESKKLIISDKNDKNIAINHDFKGFERFFERVNQQIIKNGGKPVRPYAEFDSNVS